MTNSEAIETLQANYPDPCYGLLRDAVDTAICALSAQPEPAIPLQWIEAQIERLKSLDNSFSALTALQISTMVKKWKDEQDESEND